MRVALKSTAPVAGVLRPYPKLDQVWEACPPLPSHRRCTLCRPPSLSDQFRHPKGSNSFFFDFFSVQNLIPLLIDQKTTFLDYFGDFGVSPRGFLVKMVGFGVPFGVKIRGKSEKRDFVKIVLPLWK